MGSVLTFLSCKKVTALTPGAGERPTVAPIPICGNPRHLRIKPQSPFLNFVSFCSVPHLLQSSPTADNSSRRPSLLLEPQRGFCPKAQGCAVPRATLGARGRVPATTTWLCRGNERAPCPAQALLRSPPLAPNRSTPERHGVSSHCFCAQCGSHFKNSDRTDPSRQNGQRPPPPSTILNS